MKTFLSRLNFIRTGCVLVLLASVCAMPAYATYFSHSTMLTGSDSVPGDHAGASVAVSADNQTLIFGAPNATVGGITNAGKVYVFTRNADGSWTQQAALIEPGTPGSDGLGSSVALSADGNTAVIGAPGATVNGQTGAGEVYVYTRSGSTWSEQTFFSDPTPTANDQFGAQVAVSGDAKTLLVGAPFVTVNSQSKKAGAAFVYSQSNGTWSAPTKLTASDAAATSYFGAVALSADGNTALIGARGTGKAYFFTRSGSSWSMSKEFTDPGSGSDFFGAAVALSGDGQTAAVGAYYTTIAGPQTPFGEGAGEAYIYTLAGGSWSLQQSIPNPLTQTGNKQGGFEGNFGSALSLSADGNTALITADQVGAVSSAGQAFTFARSGGTWTELKEIDDPGQQSHDEFGGSAALNSRGDTAFVGSLGSSYVWVIDSPADLSLALTADHSTVSPGQSLTYLLTATNKDTEVTATHVSVADTLPSGVTATHSTSGCTGITGTVTCVDAALSPGATYQPSITVTAPANATGVPFNMPDAASVSGDQVDLNAANNGAGVDTIVLAGSGGTAPVASDSSITTPENTAATETLLATGSGLTFAIVAQPTHGTAKVTNATTGAFIYTPAPGYTGTDSFKFTASSSGGTSNTATETIMVSASGNGGSTPVASNGTTTMVGQEANGTLSATGSGPLTFTIVAKPSHGTATLTDATKGTFTYTPDSGYSGADGFAFTAQNSTGASNIAVETVTISAKSSGSSSSGDSSSTSSGKSGGGGLGLLGLGLLSFTLIRRRRWNA